MARKGTYAGNAGQEVSKVSITDSVEVPVQAGGCEETRNTRMAEGDWGCDRVWWRSHQAASCGARAPGEQGIQNLVLFFCFPDQRSGARMSFAQEDYQPGKECQGQEMSSILHLRIPGSHPPLLDQWRNRRGREGGLLICQISQASHLEAKALLQEVVSSAMADQDRGGRKGKGKGQRAALTCP